MNEDVYLQRGFAEGQHARAPIILSEPPYHPRDISQSLVLTAELPRKARPRDRDTSNPVTAADQPRAVSNSFQATRNPHPRADLQGGGRFAFKYQHLRRCRQDVSTRRHLFQSQLSSVVCQHRVLAITFGNVTRPNVNATLQGSFSALQARSTRG